MRAQQLVGQLRGAERARGLDDPAAPVLEVGDIGRGLGLVAGEVVAAERAGAADRLPQRAERGQLGGQADVDRDGGGVGALRLKRRAQPPTSRPSRPPPASAISWYGGQAERAERER